MKQVNILVDFRASDNFSGSYAVLTITPRLLDTLKSLQKAASGLPKLRDQLRDRIVGDISLDSILQGNPITIFNGELDDDLADSVSDWETPVATEELLTNDQVLLSTTTVSVYASGQVDFKAWDKNCECEFELTESLHIDFLQELFNSN